MVKKILIAFGTRPEAIKMAPVIKALKNDTRFEFKVFVTGQHREMLDQVLTAFDIRPDCDLNIMSDRQSLNDLTARILTETKVILETFSPDVVLVQGDTATTFAVSLAAYYEKIKIAHIEAGLRTGDIYSPWPEEGNRRLTSVLADYHYAPTEINRKNLLREGVPNRKIVVTGNTVVDALFSIQEDIQLDKKFKKEIEQNYAQVDFEKLIILVTSHRRENLGSGVENICHALKKIAGKFPESEIVFPVHLNPILRGPIIDMISGIPNIKLIEPLDYKSFVYFMAVSYLVLTDSGGIQEEAPSLGKPVLVMRETTERQEGLDAGTVKLVGTQVDDIVLAVGKLIKSKSHYVEMSQAINPYGDGKASACLLAHLAEV